MWNLICGTKSNTVVYKEDDFFVSLTSIKDLKSKYAIKNWKNNRPPDNSRVLAIKEAKNSSLCPGILCGFLYENTLIIYDGIHRLLAYDDEDYVLIKIVDNDNEDYVKEDFQKINSAISLPYLYLEENNTAKKQVIEAVMLKMCVEWRPNLSASRKCHKQNFNRDTFIESVLNPLQIDWTQKELSILLWQYILLVNNQASEYVYENKIQVAQKTKTSGFYLMYLSPETIRSKLEEFF